MEKQFKILLSHDDKCTVKSVPWSFVEGHEKQALSTHSQTLERLNERGGLHPVELRCVVNDISFWKKPKDWTSQNCIKWLEEQFCGIVNTK